MITTAMRIKLALALTLAATNASAVSRGGTPGPHVPMPRTFGNGLISYIRNSTFEPVVVLEHTLPEDAAYVIVARVPQCPFAPSRVHVPVPVPCALCLCLCLCLCPRLRPHLRRGARPHAAARPNVCAVCTRWLAPSVNPHARVPPVHLPLYPLHPHTGGTRSYGVMTHYWSTGEIVNWDTVVDYYVDGEATPSGRSPNGPRSLWCLHRHAPPWPPARASGLLVLRVSLRRITTALARALAASWMVQHLHTLGRCLPVTDGCTRSRSRACVFAHTRPRLHGGALLVSLMEDMACGQGYPKATFGTFNGNGNAWHGETPPGQSGAWGELKPPWPAPVSTCPHTDK